LKVLATYNIKGGVGKTASAVNLAHVAAAEGARVLIWDLDPQGAATFYFRVKPKVKGGAQALVSGKRELDDVVKGTDFDNLDLVPADFTYRNLDLILDATKKPTRRLGRLIRPLRDDYDYVFLDCPPSISLVSESVFEASDALLVPLIPTTLSMRTFQQLDSFLDAEEWRKPPKVIAFFSMVDGRKKMHKQVIQDASAEKLDVLGTTIAAASDVERMGERRSPVTAYAPNSRSAGSYRALWKEAKKRL
jgi:cellulose biosynthesis protein BcsQ